MKKIITFISNSIFVFVGVFLSLSACAAPMKNFHQVAKQPDGTEVDVYLSGDEIFNYITDSSGNIITKNDAGYYVYASLENGKISPSSVVLGDAAFLATDENNEFLIADNIPSDIIESAYENSRFALESNNEASLSSSAIYKETDFNGMDINNIVIFIEFNDLGYTKDELSFYEGIFNTNVDSASNYFDEISYGKVGLNSHFYPQTTLSTILTYKAPENADYYTAESYYTEEYAFSYEALAETEQSLFKSAIDSVKNQISADLDIDKNNDGYVDMITFILPGKLVSGNDEIRWPHEWKFWNEYQTTINGVMTNEYTVQVEWALRGYGNSAQKGSAIIAHESLHVLGFPDMYYYELSNHMISLDEWDIMCGSNGGHPTSYMKETYGNWLEIPEIKKNGNYTLSSLKDGGTCAVKLRSPYSTNEYFIIELRRSTGTFECNIPTSGLVIYRVLADHRGIGNSYATTNDGTDDELRYLGCKAFDSYSPKLTNGSSSGIRIYDIFANTDTATFKISFSENYYLNYFKDENLAMAISDEIGKPMDEITDEDLALVTSLSISGETGCDDNGIEYYLVQSYDLTGIEHLTGLTELYLNNCQIDDIIHLQSLTNLVTLELMGNNITDVSALSGLINLRSLLLKGNLIDDYSPLSAIYNNLIEKDFSLSDCGSAVVYIPNYDNGILTGVNVKYSADERDEVCYALEKYDASTGRLISKMNLTMNSNANSIFGETISIPSKFSDMSDTYIIIKVYDGVRFKHVMSELIIDSAIFDFVGLFY